MNQKLYNVAEGCTPFEVQELEGHKVELYLMDSFEGVKEEYVVKGGKFAVWTSLDGIDYRLFLENGYYETLKELYVSPINQIWMDFWDTADGLSKKFSKTFVYPMMGIAVILCILSLFLGDAMGAIGTYVIIGCLVVMFIAMIFVNTKTKKAIVNENVKARNRVIEYLGEEKFDALLKQQGEYMDNFYKELYPEDQEDDNASDAEDSALDNNEATLTDATAEENNEEEAADATVVEDDSNIEEAPVVDAEVVDEAPAADVEVADEAPAADAEVADAEVEEDLKK